MTDPTISLGGKRTARPAGVEARLTTLERAVQQIPSRSPHKQPSLSLVVTQVAHGFAFGDVVARDVSSWELADASDVYEPMGLVLGVLSDDTFLVGMRGEFDAPGLVPYGEGESVNDWTVYTLNPSDVGRFASDDHLAAVVPSAGLPLRSVFTTLERGRIEIHGPSIDYHDHLLEFSSNVLRPLAGFSLNDVLTYDPDCFGTGLGGWKAQSILVALGNGSATSVIGRAANSSGARADIAASADGQVLARVGGTLQFTAIGGGLLPAPTFEQLADVNITSQVTYDYPRYDTATGKWINVNLGPIQAGAATGGDKELFLDGGAASGRATTVGLGFTGSRIYLGASGATSLDFKLSGSADLNTDLCARLKTDSAGVKWYDQATGLADGSSSGALAGDEVMEWGCFAHASAASRYFRFGIDVQVADTTGMASSYKLTTHAQGAHDWRITDGNGSTFLDFNSADANTSGPVVTASTDFLASGKIYVGNTLGSTSGTIQVASSTLKLSYGVGTTVIGIQSNKVGFFNVTPVGQQTLSASIAQTTPATANAAYVQADIQKAYNDIGSLITAVNNLRTALVNLGLGA